MTDLGSVDVACHYISVDVVRQTATTYHAISGHPRMHPTSSSSIGGGGGGGRGGTGGRGSHRCLTHHPACSRD